jgi:hypothetical protein
MKRYITASTGRLLLAFAFVGAGMAALAAENDPGIGVTTHVDKISVQQSGATPLIVVSAEGSQYDTVADGKFAMHYDAAVSCKSLWDVHYFEVALSGSQSWYTVKGKNYQHKPIGSYTDLLATWGVDTGDKSRSASGRTLIGPIVPQLRDAAIDKCRLEAQKAADKNGTSLAKAIATARQFPLPTTGWIQDNLQLQAWTSCGMPQDQITWLSVFAGPPDIEVFCKARPYSEGVDTHGLPNQLDSQFQLTGLAVAASPSHYQGSCPKELLLTGTLTANKAGTTNYQWKTGNTVSAPAKLVFARAQTRQITRKIDIDHSWNRTVTLISDGPGKTSSNSVEVDFSCVTARGPGDLVAPKPPMPPLPPPPPPAPPNHSDLVPGNSLTVGNHGAQWGHTLTVNASLSNLPMQGNACGLPFDYDIRNIGAGHATAFKSRFASNQGTLHTGNVPFLKAGDSRTISGTIYLANGDYEVSVLADSQMQVAESNEGNNSATLHLKVRNCK